MDQAAGSGEQPEPQLRGFSSAGGAVEAASSWVQAVSSQALRNGGQVDVGGGDAGPAVLGVDREWCGALIKAFHSSDTRYGQIPPATGEGDQLRAAARLMAMAGQITGDTTLVTAALIANLAALAAAVAQLR